MVSCWEVSESKIVDSLVKDGWLEQRIVQSTFFADTLLKVLC
jgi:hypothetical protein